MFMNLLVVAFVLIIAYAWMVRGVFSAMLHAISALVAGVIAFAVWEPLSLMLIGMSPDRGFLSFLESVAWGVSLVVPFSLAFLFLRLVSDKVVPNNIKNNTMVDYAGGGIFGLATGVISMGILVIGIGNMRVATDFLGYQPLWYSPDRQTGAGSLVKSDSLWIPVDKIVANLYGHLSSGSMSSPQPLGYWYPELELTGFASRLSPGDGAGRNAIQPEDFRVRSVYTIGTDAASKVQDLLTIGEGGTQRYVDIDNNPVTSGTLMGYVIEFEPGAKERGKRGAGQLVISNGQVRLLAEDGNGNTKTIFPVAVVSESNKPAQYGRWLFDADGVFITSTGGTSKVPMGFEFIVPQGYTPVSLIIKNVRVRTQNLPDPVSYASVSRRDLAIKSGSILEGKEAAIEYNESTAININTSNDVSAIDNSLRLMDVVGSVAVKRNFTVSEDNEIVGGQGSFDVKLEVGRNNTPNSKKLRVERYAVGDGQAMIRLDVSSGMPFGLLSNAARTAPLDKPLKLIDQRGNVYEAIGYEYKDRELMTLRYTRGSTLSGIEDTPTLSTTRDDQQLRIMFIITKGVKITKFAIGDTVVARFDPPYGE